MKDSLPGIAVALGAIAFIFCSFLLMMSGAGDHAESYRTWIIAGAIILGSGVIASAGQPKDG